MKKIKFSMKQSTFRSQTARKEKLDKAQNFLSSIPLSKNDMTSINSPKRTPVYPSKQTHLPNTRATFYATRSIPYTLSSIIPVNISAPVLETEKSSIFLKRGGSRQNSLRRATSFQHHLQPSGAFLTKPEFSDATQKGVLKRSTYDPAFFDEITLKNSAKKTVYGLNGMLGSVISYTKPDDLIKDMNKVFKQMATRSDIELSVDPNLTLTQIRNIKRKILEIGVQLDLEKVTTASALVYFEKLCLGGLVAKDTRRLYGGVCLFLAAKVHEIKGTDFKSVADAVHDILDIDFKDILDNEFSIFSQLEFELYLPLNEIEYHMAKLKEDLPIIE
eukprot:NODE_154_length_15322_cov_0.584510.p5 type:complete len:331 gc:universal NODE_154_length_15322_cov_0.584510:3554-2562(-)